VALLAVPLTAGVAHAHPWPVAPTCQGQAVSNGSRMTLSVSVFAVPPAVPPLPYEVTCHVYVNGQYVGSVEGNHIELVIVGAEVFTVPLGGYSFCVEWEHHAC
jgi:hypothetical protein